MHKANCRFSLGSTNTNTPTNQQVIGSKRHTTDGNCTQKERKQNKKERETSFNPTSLRSANLIKPQTLKTHCFYSVLIFLLLLFRYDTPRTYSLPTPEWTHDSAPTKAARVEVAFFGNPGFVRFAFICSSIYFLSSYPGGGGT